MGHAPQPADRNTIKLPSHTAGNVYRACTWSTYKERSNRRRRVGICLRARRPLSCEAAPKRTLPRRRQGPVVAAGDAADPRSSRHPPPPPPQRTFWSGSGGAVSGAAPCRRQGAEVGRDGAGARPGEAQLCGDLYLGLRRLVRAPTRPTPHPPLSPREFGLHGRCSAH